MKTPIATGTLQEERGSIRFIEQRGGHLRIYEWPKEHCVIGADVAEGINEDESAAVVLNCEFNSTMAAYNDGRIDPDSFAVFLKMLGKWYIEPLIGVERNAVGFSVVSDLIKIYPKKDIYFHHRYDERTKVKTKKFGWVTDQRTKHLMFAYLKQEIRENSTELNDKLLIHQCMQVVNEEGKVHATEGEKDDLVIARCIAGMMRRHRPVRDYTERTIATAEKAY